jgi:hypothetical protein
LSVLFSKRPKTPGSIAACVMGNFRNGAGFRYHNKACLWRIDLRGGHVLEQRLLPVPNRDWEDLASDTKGYLYIGDFGNNLNRRRDLCIFKYHPETGVTDSILFAYPDQKGFPPATENERVFDCEAMIFFRDSLYLFTKGRFNGRHFTKEYVLPAQPGRYVAQLRDSAYLRKRVVSGAAISSDGRTLALTSYYVKMYLKSIPSTKATVWYFFDPTGDGRFFKSRPDRRRLPKFLIARQFESIVEVQPGRWMAANESIVMQKASFWRIKSPKSGKIKR